MPYITSETVKDKRNQIKKAFPKFKFSITKEHYSGINVAILEAPFNMLTEENIRGHEQVNHYCIERHYEDYPKIKKVLMKIYDIMSEGRRIISEDGDYGSIPNFYTNLSIGKWDKPFKIKRK